jgi:hypothetical protein
LANAFHLTSGCAEASQIRSSSPCGAEFP